MEKTICDNPRTAQYPSYAIRSLNNSPNPVVRRRSYNWAEGNRSTGWSYNELNLPVSMTDAEGEVTRFSYDELGRETSRILPNGITRETTYDKAGRITSISHDEEWNNGNHHGYGRNSRRNGRLPSRLYAYNETGQKILQVDELGRLTAWEYDNAGRLSEASYSFAGGKSVADFRERIYLGVIPEEIKNGHHNGHNRDEGWLNGRGSSRYEMGNLFGRNSVLQDLGFSEEDFSSGLEETYNELSDVFPDLKGFDYRAAARMKGHSFFEKDRSSLSGRLPGEVRRWFSHGELNRLLRQPLWTEEFSYDQAGNIAGKTNGWGEIAYTYNEENRLTKAGEREYSWDANGNMTGESLGMLSASYSYDGENRLTRITSNHRGFLGSPGRPMDKGILYSYDSFGRRISREEITDLHGGRYRDRFANTGERVSYLYDGLGFDVLAEDRDGAGRSRRGGWYGNSGRVFNPTSEYLKTNGSVIVRNDITGSGRSFLDFFHGGSLSKSYCTQDGLGSVMGTFSRRGTLEKRYAYDSFGRLTEGRFDGENRLGYNGKRIDPYSGRYDYGFRDYDPMVMRWTTVDPVKDGANWYVYVENDPVNYIDPLGLCSEEVLGVDDINWLTEIGQIFQGEIRIGPKLGVELNTPLVNVGVDIDLSSLGSEFNVAGEESQTVEAGFKANIQLLPESNNGPYLEYSNKRTIEKPEDGYLLITDILLPYHNLPIERDSGLNTGFGDLDDELVVSASASPFLGTVSVGFNFSEFSDLLNKAGTALKNTAND
ncbi:MAG: RHS repeat-associated core domain-containing protein [Spirochaetia bacterium]|nr:RHS repeat-associated core domain-containing protein [Spirochaetia bacterium]